MGEIILFKYFALFFGWVEMFCFGGAIFGLNALYESFRKENLFIELCNRSFLDNKTALNGSTPCLNQNKYFGYILITTMTSQCILALPLGMFYDKFGQRKSKLFAAFVFGAACTLFGLSFHWSSWLVFPAAILFGVSAQIIIFCNIALGSLFLKFQNIIVSFLSGCLDSSSVMMTFIALSHNAGVRLSTSFSILGISGFIIMGSSAIFVLKHVDNYLLIFRGQSKSTGQGDGDKIANRSLLATENGLPSADGVLSSQLDDQVSNDGGGGDNRFHIDYRLTFRDFQD